MTTEQVDIALSLVLGQITFINEVLIDESVWTAADELVADVDPDDVDFVALTNLLDATLWTGDKLLHGGLRGKGYARVVNTDELWTLRTELAK